MRPLAWLDELRLGDPSAEFPKPRGIRLIRIYCAYLDKTSKDIVRRTAAAALTFQTWTYLLSRSPGTVDPFHQNLQPIRQVVRRRKSSPPIMHYC
jgi:hypothetical protein